MPAAFTKHRPRYRPSTPKRPSAAARGYDGKWQQARDAFLRRNPWCIDCLARGVMTEATVVDHEIPHRGDKAKFWDKSNWCSRCKADHDAKTARRDGGFGNPMK